MAKTRRIAVLLKITELEAAAFCDAVRDLCRPLPVDNRAILVCLEGQPAVRHSAEAVATAIKRRYPTAPQPIRSYSRGQRLRRVPRPLPPPGHPEQHIMDDTFVTQSPALRHDARDATTMLTKCPHGVPTGYRCQICHPDKTSWD